MLEIAISFCRDLFGPFTRNAYIKMLPDCNLLSENTQHFPAACSTHGGLCQWESGKWSSVAFKEWEPQLWLELKGQWSTEQKSCRLGWRGSWAHWGLRALHVQWTVLRGRPLMVFKTFQFGWFSRNAFDCWLSQLSFYVTIYWGFSMSHALSKARFWLPGSFWSLAADFIDDSTVLVPAQRSWCLSWVWNCGWRYWDGRVQEGQSRDVEGHRKPWRFGPTHCPPLMQGGPLVFFHMSFQTKQHPCTWD